MNDCFARSFLRNEAKETAKTKKLWEAQPQVFDSIVGEGSAAATTTAHVPPKVDLGSDHASTSPFGLTLTYPVAPATT